MNIRDLEYVIAVGKYHSFSKAAASCYVSQPSLSTQIKKLEDELGADLFARNRRKVSTTAFGTEFIKHAEDVMMLVHKMKNLNKAPEREGQVNLGGILTVAPYLFSYIAQQASKEEPHLNIAFKEAKTEILLQDLLTGALDAAILSLPTDTHAFDTATLFEDEFFVAVAENNPLAKLKSVRTEDLKQEKFVLLEEGHCLRNQALDICQSAAALENQMFQATSLETIRHFVATGEAMTLMPNVAKRGGDGIAYVPIQNKNFTRDIALVWRKNTKNTAMMETLTGLIANAYASKPTG